MKISITTLFALLTFASHSALATGAIVSLDCRQGANYWDTNKGISIDLRKMTAASYKDNGHTQGDIESIQCQAKKNSLLCQGDGFVLRIPNASKVFVQESNDVGDALGSLLGVGNKAVKVTKGVLETDGLIFASENPVVCAVDYELNY